jgi:peptide/nickel transport system ATP-binding protein
MTGSLRYEHLTVELPGTARPVLDDVSFEVEPGEVVGLVGESGSGKSTTARAAVGFFPDGAHVGGTVRLADDDVLALDEPGLRRLRSRRLAMVYQDPRAAVNPVRTVGAYATEQLHTALGMSRGDARDRVLELFSAVGLPDPRRQIDQHPHELSGGMLQRVVIAAALAGEPSILLADEPTSALDVSTQASIVALLLRLRRERGLGVLFITHDLALAAAICDRVCVMYAGRIVEVRSGERLFESPRHPYTAGLRDSTPKLLSGRTIRPIAGAPPSLGETVAGCSFATRCAYAEPACRDRVQTLEVVDDGAVACRRHRELDLSERPHLTSTGGKP